MLFYIFTGYTASFLIISILWLHYQSFRNCCLFYSSLVYLQFCQLVLIKVIVHFSQVVLNLYEFLSSAEHRGRYLKNVSNQTVDEPHW